MIGGSTGTMLEALDVVGGDSHNDSPLASVGTITVSFAMNNVVYDLVLLIVSPRSFLYAFFTIKFTLGSNTHP